MRHAVGALVCAMFSLSACAATDPSDYGVLYHVTFAGGAQRAEVVVDVCSECRGMWLDGGELQKLLN